MTQNKKKTQDVKENAKAELERLNTKEAVPYKDKPDFLGSVHTRRYTVLIDFQSHKTTLGLFEGPRDFIEFDLKRSFFFEASLNRTSSSIEHEFLIFW